MTRYAVLRTQLAKAIEERDIARAELHALLDPFPYSPRHDDMLYCGCGRYIARCAWTDHRMNCTKEVPCPGRQS